MTLALLDSAGVLVTGVDTLATPVATERGDTIAFLGFYTSTESPDARDLAAVRRHVARAVTDYRASSWCWVAEAFCSNCIIVF